MPVEHPREPRYGPWTEEEISHKLDQKLSYKNLMFVKVYGKCLGKTSTFYEKRNVFQISIENNLVEPALKS